MYKLSDKFVFNTLKNIKFGYLEITHFNGEKYFFGNNDESLKVEVKINSAGRPDVWLFSETGGVIIELEENVLPQAQAVMSKYNIHYEEIGETTQHQAMVFGEIIHMPILKAKDSWQRSLRNKIQ